MNGCARLAFAGLILAAPLDGGVSVGDLAGQAIASRLVSLVRVPDAGIQPQVAVDEQGTVHLVYFKGEPAHGDLFYASRSKSSDEFSVPIKVNNEPASAIATGTVRGAHVAVGRGGRVHVAWNGSDRAVPRAPGDSTPMLYTRLNETRTGFEPQRNLLQFAVGLDGGGSLTADTSGHVYVVWHANSPGSASETDRRVWLAVSENDGRTFMRERPLSDAATGACGCCGLGALADLRGSLFVLYRSARDLVNRDTYLVKSIDRGANISADRLDEWNINACPMTTFALAPAAGAVLAAWETAGQVQFVRVDAATGRRSAVVDAPGAARNRKHPAIAQNARGDVLLAWTEGMGWSRGGSVAWQVFDKTGAPTAEQGRAAGVPMWSLVAAYATAEGFVIVY